MDAKPDKLPDQDSKSPPEPTMTAREAVEMMLRCKNEIQALRNYVAQLEPRAIAYDQICTILRLLPQPQRGQGEDVLWTINKRIEEMTSRPNPSS